MEIGSDCKYGSFAGPSCSAAGSGTSRKESLRRLARQALERYGLGEARIALIKGDVGKHLFRVTAPDGQEYVLRTYRFSYADWNRLLTSEQALRSQSVWLKKLGESGLSVPDPIPASDGTLTVAVSVAGLSRLRVCVLQRWIPGIHKRITDLHQQDLHGLGAYVACMHRQAEEFSPPPGFQRPTWGWSHLFGSSTPLWEGGARIYPTRDMSVLYATARRVMRDLERLGRGREVFGVIHRDLNLSNVVFDEGDVSAVDFDSCGWGYYLYDLAQMLLKMREAGERYPELREALISGYRSERALPNHQLDLLETFVAMRRVARITSDLTRRRHDDIEALRAFTANERGLDNYLKYRLSLWTRR